jgi:HK97 family phage portal protein
MNMFRSLAFRMAAKLAGKHPRDPALAEWFGYSPTASGAQVTPDTALAISAVFSCVRVLAETVAALPFPVYRRLPAGGREVDPRHSLHALLNVRPNAWQTAFEFRELMVVHLCLRGNFYAYKVMNGAGATTELLPLHPDRVRTFWAKEGVPAYAWSPPAGGPERVLLSHEIHHIRFFPSNDGLLGLSPIKLHRETLGLAMAGLEYGARFFGNDATPGGVIQAPDVLNDEDVKAFRKYWEKHHKGAANAHKTAILEAGMEWKQITISPEDAQYIEGRKFSVTDICRIYRVPPHLVADLEKATFSNIEHQSLSFVQHTLVPWLARIEQASERDLLSERDRASHFVEALVDGLLRGDFKSRQEGYALALRNGVLSINEVRQMENRNPIEGGDVHMVQMQMAPLDALGQDPVPALPPPPEDDARVRQLLAANAERVVRKAVQAVRRAHERALKAGGADGFREWAKQFFGNHADMLSGALAIDHGLARTLANNQLGELLAAAEAEEAGDGRCVPPLLDSWEIFQGAALVARALEGEAK